MYIPSFQKFLVTNSQPFASKLHNLFSTLFLLPRTWKARNSHFSYDKLIQTIIALTKYYQQSLESCKIFGKLRKLENLAKNISNFVSLPWKLNHPYCHNTQCQVGKCAFLHFKSFLIRLLFFKFSRGDSSRELQPLRFSDVKNKELVVQSAKNRKKRINE